ncbi:winged helix-turn-helix domain-containing protein [Chryseobacterium sp.]|uniref:ArsR/SmtB family transcription factor n=1 Tax=Chryseobacterium sp. TaxID=1871047 RepID=UPI0025BD5669|nr:winged helix-turn-helix domain-containing protein [Chryseobacterium sp.]
MDAIDQFSKITALIGEPSRAKILWSLLDGKAYTASELAAFANISTTSASNHLSKLLASEILKVEVQGRHRYYNFSHADVAYAVEALAQLSKVSSPVKTDNIKPAGIKYCRTCYDHLAGYVGCQIVDIMESKGYLEKEEKQYRVTTRGWDWLQQLDIKQSDYKDIRRPLTRYCLDWSERRPHLAGKLGADLLEKMIFKNWFRKVQFSRELIITTKGTQEIYKLLGISL